MKVSIATWNTEWRSPRSRDGKLLKERLLKEQPEVVCLTEAHHKLLADFNGYQIEGTTDWGGPTFGVRRKVLLWSREPWTEIDAIGSVELPPGRFVMAKTHTSIGELTVVGIVIPYHMANVRYGTRNRKMWEDHERYLDALPSVLASISGPIIVMGDFNQRMPNNWVPMPLQEKLIHALRSLNLGTKALRGPDGKPTNDHIACSDGIGFDEVRALSNDREDEKQISDHFGVVARIALVERGSSPAPVGD